MRKKASMIEVEKTRQKLLKEWGNRHFVNMLDEMMKIQKQFGSKFIDFDYLTIQQREKWTKEFVICCFDELSEIINWTNWKHWKKPKYPISEIEVKYEIIDLFHFILSLMLVWKMTPTEVFSMYVSKNRENHKRQKEGY